MAKTKFWIKKTIGTAFAMPIAIYVGWEMGFRTLDVGYAKSLNFFAIPFSYSQFASTAKK